MRKSYPKKTYRRKRYVKKPWYDRVTLGDTGRGAYDLATKAIQGVQYIKGLVNSELYKYDVATNFSPSTAGALTNCCAIAQGDGTAARTGNSLLAKSLYIQFNIVNNGSATNGAIVSSWVIMDTQQVGDTSPSFNDIFDGQNVISQLNAATVGRFKILHHKLHYVSPNTPTKQSKIYLKMQHHIRYNGAAGTDIQKGGIYWVVCSNQGTYVPLVTYNLRLCYHDN